MDNRLRSETLTEVYEYDLNNNVISYSDSKGNNTIYLYDAANRLKQTVLPNGVKATSSYSTFNTPTFEKIYDDEGDERSVRISYDEENKNDCPSYIDFFFNAKVMVDFIKDFIEKENFEKCYIAPVYNDRYKLKSFDDDVCKDVYDEFKTLLNSLGLKTNTSSAIQLNKKEILEWCDRISVGAFCGVSQFSIVIPELDLLVIPYHHMNFLLYSNDKAALLRKINIDDKSELRYQL